jgi:hypothetical protein
VLTLLTVTINALENAADQIDAGSSAESVLKNLEGAQSPILVTASTAVRSILRFMFTDCPWNP